MSLDDYAEPKGAYYTPALIATFAAESDAEDAIASLRAAGFSKGEINVTRESDHVTVVVSGASADMLGQARGLLTAGGAREVRPYGAGADTV